MRLPTHALALHVILILAAASPVPAQSAGARLPAPVEQPVEPLVAVNGRPALDWAALAGKYVRSDGFTSEVVTLSADGSFMWGESSCTSDEEFRGTLHDAAGLVAFEVVSAQDLRSSTPLPKLPTLEPRHPVRWGERLYLVAESGLERFCNFVNAGMEPVQEGDSAYHLMRSEDDQREVAGLPDVPEAWREKLLPRPVIGRVVAANAGVATLDLGARDGVQPGMWLGAHLQSNSDWAVSQGQPWFYSRHVIVETVEETTCTTRQDLERRHVPGQPVSGLLPHGGLELRIWRAAGDDPRIMFEPLPPVLTATQQQLERWTASIRESYSPGVPLADVDAAPLDRVDELTPAFLNALRGLDMSDAQDVATAGSILAVWQGYLSRAGKLRSLRFPFETVVGYDALSEANVARRVTLIETFAMWWRAMSADPERYADYRRGRSP